MFEFYIDGVLYDDPLNWQDFTEVIEYDTENKFISLKYDVNLEFSGTAYEYLYNKKITDGFCYIAEIIIKQQTCSGGEYATILTGTLILADCKFHINKCVVDCSIEDNNISALLFNNRNVGVFLNATGSEMKSKNGYDISFTNAAGFSNAVAVAWDCFNPVGNAPLTGGVIAFRVYDAFKYMIMWLTDDQIGFESDLLDYTTSIVTEADNVKSLAFMTGSELRIGYNGYFRDNQMPSITFSELFVEVNRLYPLALTIEYTSTGRPVIRIEEFSTIRASASAITINNIADLTESVDTQFLFSSISLGGVFAEYNSSLHSYTIQKADTFIDEKYYLAGQCNIDKELDLTGKWVCDTNIIQEMRVTNPSNTNWDSNMIFMEVVSTSDVSCEAIPTLNPDNADYHYNNNLMNSRIMIRNPVANDAILNSGNGLTDLTNHSTGNSLTAFGLQTDPAGFVMPPLQTSAFFVPSFATGANLAVFTAGNKYTALVAGSYTFNIQQDVRCTAIQNRVYSVHYEYRRYDSFNVLQETQVTNFTGLTTFGYVGLGYYPKTFTMAIGDYVVMYMAYSSQPVDFTLFSAVTLSMGHASTSSSTWNTGNVPSSGGLITQGGALDYDAAILEFTFPLPIQDYLLYKQDIRKNISLNTGNSIQKTGWVRKITRVLASTNTEFELISNITQTS